MYNVIFRSNKESDRKKIQALHVTDVFLVPIITLRVFLGVKAKSHFRDLSSIDVGPQKVLTTSSSARLANIRGMWLIWMVTQ